MVHSYRKCFHESPKSSQIQSAACGSQPDFTRSPSVHLMLPTPDKLQLFLSIQSWQHSQTHTPFVVLAPMPLGMQPQDDRALLCSLPLLAPSHSPFCSYPGWPAGGLNHRWQIFADRGNVLSPKTLGRCLCTHSREVKQGTGPRKEQPEVLHLWGSLGTAHHQHDQRLKKPGTDQTLEHQTLERQT